MSVTRWVDPMLSKPPPPSWRRDIAGDGERMKAWTTTTTNAQRHNAWTAWNKTQACFQKAKDRLQSEPGNRYLATFVANGGQNRYTTSEETARARVRAVNTFNARVSASRLAYRLAHSPGCSIAGCPLGPRDDTEPLLHLLKRVGAERWTEATAERASVDPVEQAKLSPPTMCAWHHHLQSRDRSRDRFDQLGQMKAKAGCQHPLHGIMPYADLLPSSKDDRRIVAFLHVSHVRRGQERGRSWGRDRNGYIRDLQAGDAVIHCDFCHRLTTLCEIARLHDTEYGQRQFALLLRRFPSFVQHFDEATAGFDWAAETARLRTRISDAHCKRAQIPGAHRKHKRRRVHTEDDEDAMDEVHSMAVATAFASAGARSAAIAAAFATFLVADDASACVELREAAATAAASSSAADAAALALAAV